MDYFLIERLMGLFWVGVQQFCFVCLKYAHDDIVTNRGGAAKAACMQGGLFVLLALFCFEREVGLFFFSEILRFPKIDYFPWAVRIALCGAMILFDSLLVLYFWRIVRVYRHGLAAARPTLPGDLGVGLFVVVLCVSYIWGGIGASVRHGFNMSQYMWIGRFFIQISNFFYIALEIGGAVLFWLFLKRLKSDKIARNAAGGGGRDV